MKSDDSATIIARTAATTSAWHRQTEQSAAHRAGDHAEPRDGLDRPVEIAFSHHETTNAAPETGQGAGDIGQADRQSLDMFHGRVDHAHRRNDQIETQQAELLRLQDRCEGEKHGDAGKHAENPSRHHMRNDDAECIADDEDENGRQQNDTMRPVAIGERDGGSRRIACHERDEIAREA